jgi:hypothetical protein
MMGHLVVACDESLENTSRERHAYFQFQIETR